MTTVYYSHSIPYRDVPGAGMVPAVEVELFLGGQSARTVGVLDSGSTHTVFSVEFAEQLGIEDVTRGQLVTATTLGGRRDFYLFELEMTVRVGEGPVRFPGQIGFFPVRSPRNILGRILVFSHFEIGFRESLEQVHIRPDV